MRQSPNDGPGLPACHEHLYRGRWLHCLYSSNSCCCCDSEGCTCPRIFLAKYSSGSPGFWPLLPDEMRKLPLPFSKLFHSSSYWLLSSQFLCLHCQLLSDLPLIITCNPVHGTIIRYSWQGELDLGLTNIQAQLHLGGTKVSLLPSGSNLCNTFNPLTLMTRFKCHFPQYSLDTLTMSALNAHSISRWLSNQL